MDLEAEGILDEFEGQAVKATGVEVSNAAGGLNKSLEVDPSVMAIGETVYVLMQCDVTSITHKPIKDDEGNLMRVHRMRATDVTFIEDIAPVKQALSEQRERIRKFQEEKAGILRLPGTDDVDEPPAAVAQ
jgi:hypothetical protein